MTYADLDPRAAQAELQRDKALRILDVRTPREHQSHRLPGAVLIPVHELPLRYRELDPQVRWLVHCEHGVRSRSACQMLQQLGFGQLVNLRGGLAQWVADGLPLG